MATAHELPDLPSLPPLMLSSPHIEYPSVNETLAEDVHHFLKSPAMSFAESFTTAYTSHTPGEEYEDFTRLDISSLSLSQDIQKSVSEDAGSRSHQEDYAQHSTANSALTSSTGTGAHGDAQAVPREPIWSSRHRGESFSSLVTAHDLDRDEDESVSPVSGERFRHQSLQSQEAPMLFVRGGDLPLPSRTPMGSMSNSSANYSEQIVSSTSLQSIPSQHSSYNAPGRVRSGSLGFSAPNFSKRTVVNTYPQVSVRLSIYKA
jgi:hypothetical protein